MQWFEDPIKFIRRFDRVSVALPIHPSFGGLHRLHLTSKEDWEREGVKVEVKEFPLTFSSEWECLHWFKKMGAHANLVGKKWNLSELKKMAHCSKPFQTVVTVGFLEK